MLEYIILGMLLDEARTGYDVKKLIENGIGTFYKASYGSLYPALKKLTDKGLLTMFEQSGGGRQKKFYQTTQQGKTVFFEWLSAPMDLSDNTSNHLAKVFFFDNLPVDIHDQQLREYELSSINYLRKLQALERKYAAMEHKDCFYYKLSTLYYGICITQANIEWCRHIRDKKPLTELIEKGAL